MTLITVRTYTNDAFFRFGLTILFENNILQWIRVLLWDLELKLGLRAVHLEVQIRLKPVSEFSRWGLLDPQSVVHVCFASALFSVNLEMLDPSALLSVDLFALVVPIAEPILG